MAKAHGRPASADVKDHAASQVVSPAIDSAARPSRRRDLDCSPEEMEVKARELARTNLHDALPLFQQVLQLRREQLGNDDPQTREAELDLAEISNRIAQELIQLGRTTEAPRHVQQSQALTQHALPDPDQNARRLFLRAQVFNSMTCLSKAQGNIRAALKHCEKGLTIMLQLNMLSQLPTCYLNVCALYSTLGLHAEALKHASLALQILRELINALEARKGAAGGLLPSLSTSSILEQERQAYAHQDDEVAAWMGFEGPLPSTEMGVTHTRLTALGTQLAITYFNIAVEQEYLLDFPACVRTYQVAITTAEDFLGPGNLLTKKFKKTLKKAMLDEEKAALATREEQQRKKQTKYKYCITSTASVPSVYQTNVEKHPPHPRPIQGFC